MSRIATDDDVTYLVARLERIISGILQAHAEGYGPSDNTEQSVADIVAGLLQTPILDASRRLATEISSYYLSVYRYMIARVAPTGVEMAWLTIADLLRTISDAYTDVARQLSKSAPAGDTRDALTTVRYGKDQLRRIAATVDAETAARAHAAATALVIALSPSSDGNPLSLQDRKLLRLLVSGNTIEEIASQLQVSRRTVHRRLHAVWDQAGASSRTEGIAIVSARGWLD